MSVAPERMSVAPENVSTCVDYKLVPIEVTYTFYNNVDRNYLH